MDASGPKKDIWYAQLLTRRRQREPPPLTYDSWLRQRYVQNGARDPWEMERHLSCRVLKDQGIACLVWFEDAVRYYGVSTFLFDLHLLVSDVKQARAALVERGWEVVTPRRSQTVADIQDELCFLRRLPPRAPTKPSMPAYEFSTVLMPVKHWRLVLPNITSTSYQNPGSADRWPFMPSLHDTLNALIRKWLETSFEQIALRRYVGLMIAYLYRYVPIVRSTEFIELLAPEHRQYFLDLHAGMNMQTVDAHDHEKEIRDSVGDAGRMLVECSVSRDDERYFPEKRWQRITESQRRYKESLPAYEPPDDEEPEEVDDEGEGETAAATQDSKPGLASRGFHRFRSMWDGVFGVTSRGVCG
ncbi:MAG: hypothetical protein M1826_001628 [Phylliscum demangeonii]|nr:MAG: hypothetical protein M1826_001628 [Phylliscum demangeonii]